MRKIHVKCLELPWIHIKCLFKCWQLYFLMLLFCNPFRNVNFFSKYLENHSSSWVPNLSPLPLPSSSNLPTLPSWYVGRTPVAPTQDPLWVTLLGSVFNFHKTSSRGRYQPHVSGGETEWKGFSNLSKVTQPGAGGWDLHSGFWESKPFTFFPPLHTRHAYRQN